MDKQTWLDIAEVIDAHRVFPKTILILVLSGYGVLTYDTYFWVKEIYIQTSTIPTSVALFSGGVVTALGGVLTLLINKYFEGGRKWNE